MIYLDHGATSFPKPAPVRHAVTDAMLRCANPGRSGHEAAMAAARLVYDARCTAAKLFSCAPEQVVFTSNCTHGLNIAIRTLVKPGDRVVISGFEHNAVTRTLHDLGAEIIVAGRKLFDWEDSLREFQKALEQGPKAAVFTHVSNVFGYILPVQEMGWLCRCRGIPFIVDAAQSAGHLPVSLSSSGASFIAMPGHKGLLGPMGTGLLLCAQSPEPVLTGGTGSESESQSMPLELPERCEAGTVNVPGIAGLDAGMKLVLTEGIHRIGRREAQAAKSAAEQLEELGLRVFHGANQAGTLSFVPNCDCEELADCLARQGIAVRAGLHCAPLAHESAGTLATGTVRASVGFDTTPAHIRALVRACAKGKRQ